MPSCSVTQNQNTATGNLISGVGSDGNAAGADTDAYVNYSFDPDPLRLTSPYASLVESTDPLKIAGISSNGTGASSVVSTSLSPTISGAYGTLSISSSGAYTYTINQQNPSLLALSQGQSITEVFTYTVTDGKGGSTTSTLTMTISGGNGAPVAVNNYELLTESATMPSTLIMATTASKGVLLNDRDPDSSDTFIVTQAEKGASVTDETFTTPILVTANGAESFSRNVRFTFNEVGQGTAWSGNVGDKVFIQRQGTSTWTDTGLFVNTVTTGGTKFMTFRTTAAGSTLGYLDFQLGDVLSFVTAGTVPGTIESVTGTTLSTTKFALTGTGTTPAAGSAVTGEGLQANTQVSSVQTISGIGTYVTLDKAATASTTTVNGSTLNTGEALSFVSGEVILGTYGYLNLRSNGSYEYVQTADMPGGNMMNEYFKYEISDGSCTDKAVLHLQIIPVQIMPPVGSPDTKSVTEAGVAAGTSPANGNVLTGGTADSGMAPLVVSASWHPLAGSNSAVAAGSTSVSNATQLQGLYGQLFIGSDGSYSYVLNDASTTVDALQQGSTLQEVFYYRVNDGQVTPEFGISTLTVTIQGADDAPVASADVATAVEAGGPGNSWVGFDPAGNIFVNDSDVDTADTKTLDGIGVASAAALGTPNAAGEYVITGLYGTLFIKLDGSYRYVVDQSNAFVDALSVNQTLLESFNYSVKDSLLATSLSTLTITIEGAEDLVSITSVNVNEASPYAVFTVTGAANQIVALALDITGSDVGDATRGDAADFGTTAGTGLEVFNGANWVAYAGGNVALNGSGQLLVRSAIRQDTTFENQESFLINATTADGNTATGTGVIFDDGTGGYFAADNNTATSLVPVGVVLDDDRVLSVTVSSPTVNEASPWAVFGVTGVAGQQLTLSLTEGSGTSFANIDETKKLQYWDGSNWVDYTAASLVTLPAGGVLLVRVDIAQEQETALDGPETFQLVATNTGGTPYAGTSTIVDDGTGVKYPDLPPTNPSTPATTTTGLDDDRVMAVTNVTVNEASPYAVFTVTGVAGQEALLSITNNVDGSNLTGIEYYDGSAWVVYTSGSVTLPAGGSLLVRVAISPEQETALDGPETFTLVAATTSGTVSTGGTGTINDDGTGSVFLATNTTATPNVSGDPGYPATLDDDRVMAVTNVTVNEASPYAVFTVTGANNQALSLSLANQNADGSNLSTLQYFDGTTWQNYTGGSYVTLLGAGSLRVRVAISPEQEAALDGPETFQLVATNTGGSPYSGTGNIVDDGTGDYWIADSTTPATLQELVDAAIVLDDDRNYTIKWGIANADPFNGLMDATIIGNDTSSPHVYAGMDQGRFDLHMTVAGLGGNNLQMLGGQASWSMSPRTSPSTTSFRFYKPGTTTPQPVRNIHFSIEDAEFGEELSNFSYWDATGTKVTLPWSDTAFTYSATPIFRNNGTVVENSSYFENNPQSGKHIRIDLRGILVSGLEFNFRKRLSSAGSIVLTHLTGNPGKLEFGGIFSPLTIKANAAGLGGMPDYRTQATWQAGVVGTVTQDPAPGTLLPVGNHDVKLTLTTADDSADIGFVMTIRQRRPSVIAITGPVEGSVYVTGDATPLPLTGTVRDYEGEGIAAVEVTYGGQTLSAAVGTPDSFGISTWSLPITPVSGTNSFSVSAVDVNGIRSLTATRTFDFTRRYSFAVNANPTAGTVKPTSTHSTSTRSLSLLSTVGATKTYSVLPTANISLTAKALVGYVFSHWSGIPAGATAVPGSMRLVMPAADITGVEAHFVATPFTAPAGTSNTFYGLLKPVDAANTSNDSVAMLTGTLVPKSGTFSGRIALGGLTHRFTCTFAGNGTSWFSLDHTAPANSLTLPGGHVLDLSFDTINGTVIAALSKGGVTSQGVIQRGIYTSTNPVPQNLLNLRAPSTLVQNNLGFYTAAIPTKTQAPARTPSSYPQGDGFTTITLLNTGTLTLSGVLADGSTITASTALVTGDVSPFFAQLTTPGAITKDGSFSGSLNFVPGTDSDVTGTDLLWVRPAVSQATGTLPTQLATQLYTAGWPSGIHVDLVGAFYDTAVNVQTGLGLPSPDNTLGNGELNFSLGKLVSDVSVTAFNINANTIAKLQPKDKTFQLLVNGPRATFNGTFTPNWTPRVPALPAFRGILLQKGTNGPAGYGFFISNRGSDLDPESGRATLGAPN